MELTPVVTLAGSTVTTPASVVSTTPVDTTQQIKFSIMVRRPQSVTDYADSILAGRSKILSYDDFLNQFSASDSDLALITDFANATGLTITDSHAPGATVKLTGTAEQVNAAFGITLLLITLPDRTYMGYNGSITIPTQLENVIEYTIGLNNFTLMRPLAVPVTPDQAIPAAISALTPIQVANAYKFPAATGTGVCIGIIEYGGGYTPQNLTSTFSRIGLPNPTMIDILVDGGTNDPADTNGSPEVMLDIYVAAGVAPNATIAMYFGYGGGDSSPVPGPDWYDPINTAIHDTVNNPCVLTISWGAGETTYWSSGSIASMNAVLAQAVVIGIPVCVASGDEGSTWASSSPEVLFPASSPYVLGCGGTTLQISGTTITSEVTWTPSGGGKSVYNAKPAFQVGLTTKLYPAGTVSPLTVRGVPDVAGNSDPNTGYQFYWGTGNTFSQYGGTSACCPLYAGMIARLIQLYGRQGGLLNTLFYNNHQAFNDITVGDNASNLSTGYSATPGWDACTGLGSPIGTAIAALFSQSTQGPVFPGYVVGPRPVTGQTYPRASFNY